MNVERITTRSQMPENKKKSFLVLLNYIIDKKGTREKVCEFVGISLGTYDRALSGKLTYYVGGKILDAYNALKAIENE